MGYGREAADADLLRFLGYCADAHEKTGVVVVIEPLSYAECNILNTVDEGADMARRINRPGVRALADTYHMEANGESLASIVAAADVLAHAHTADTGRFAPGTGDYDHAALFSGPARRPLRRPSFPSRVSWARTSRRKSARRWRTYPSSSRK